MAKYIFALAFVIAITIAAYFYFVPSGNSETIDIPEAGNPMVGNVATGTDAYDTLVTFDGEKFSPKEISVQKGTRVRFLNESDEGVWPASAVHPTHSIYPEKDSENCLGSSFDSCRALKRGEFFDFTFNHAGEWRYHDHVRAFITGVVTVSE